MIQTPARDQTDPVAEAIGHIHMPPIVGFGPVCLTRIIQAMCDSDQLSFFTDRAEFHVLPTNHSLEHYWHEWHQPPSAAPGDLANLAIDHFRGLPADVRTKLHFQDGLLRWFAQGRSPSLTISPFPFHNHHHLGVVG